MKAMLYRVKLDNGTQRVSEWYERDEFACEFMKWVDQYTQRGVNYEQTVSIVIQRRPKTKGFIR